MKIKLIHDTVSIIATMQVPILQSVSIVTREQLYPLMTELNMRGMYINSTYYCKKRIAIHCNIQKTTYISRIYRVENGECDESMHVIIVMGKKGYAEHNELKRSVDEIINLVVKRRDFIRLLIECQP